MDNERIEELMKELYLQGKTYEEIGRELDISKEAARSRIRTRDYYEPYSRGRENYQEIEFDNSKVGEDYISDDIKKQLLEDAGINSDDWEVVGARISTWDAPGKDEKSKSVRLTVSKKKIDDQIRYEQLAEDIKKIEPLKLDIHRQEGKGLNLVIPLFDMHFGTSDIEYYKETLENIISHLEKNIYNNVLIISGGDILDSNNTRSTTASGTQLEQTDIQKAWLDAFQFFSTIIKKAYKKSRNLKISYVYGNHDEFSGLSLNLALEKYFEKFDIAFDISNETPFKAELLDEVMICFTHGHKSNVKKYPLIFATSYPEYWSKSKLRECFTGHFHYERTSEDYGIVLRQTSQKGRLDKWSANEGFITTHKRMQIYEYTRDELKSITVV